MRVSARRGLFSAAYSVYFAAVVVAGSFAGSPVPACAQGGCYGHCPRGGCPSDCENNSCGCVTTWSMYYCELCVCCLSDGSDTRGCRDGVAGARYSIGGQV